MVPCQGILHLVCHNLVQMDVPRVRIDQMLAFEWKYLMPFSLVNLILMAVFVALGWHF